MIVIQMHLSQAQTVHLLRAALIVQVIHLLTLLRNHQLRLLAVLLLIAKMPFLSREKKVIKVIKEIKVMTDCKVYKVSGAKPEKRVKMLNVATNNIKEMPLATVLIGLHRQGLVKVILRPMQSRQELQSIAHLVLRSNREPVRTMLLHLLKGHTEANSRLLQVVLAQ